MAWAFYSMKLTQFIFIMSLIILISFSIQQEHLLIALLVLETIILVLIAALIYEFSSIASNITHIIYLIIVIAACEAALALSILVLLSRFIGSDSIKLHSLNKC